MLTLFDVRYQEIEILHLIQKRLEPLGSIFIAGCHAGDPRYPYLFFAFFLAIASRELGLKILWAVCISEWLNTVLKWIIDDDRPYWWVPEYVQPAQQIPLKQFSITCETGPGNPSGHLMVTTCVWSIITAGLVKSRLLDTSIKQSTARTAVRVMLLIVAFGRMYISAHFPDQCILGYLAGLVTAMFLEKLIDIRTADAKLHVTGALMIVVVSLTTSYLKNRFSTHPADWSLLLAKRWCLDIKYVKPDTTPHFVIWRTSGALIGTGLAFRFLPDLLKRYIRPPAVRNSLPFRIMVGCLACCAGYLFLNCTKYSSPALDKPEAFYALTFLQYIILPSVCSLVVFLLTKETEVKQSP